MKITLDETEQIIAEGLAKMRYRINRQAGLKNARVGSQSDEFTDLNGIGGEIAFCKLANVYPPFDLRPRHGGTDCRMPSGLRVDVKTTKYPNGRLIDSKRKCLKDSDAYALMVGEFPKYEFMGWAMARELLSVPNLVDLGYGPTFALDQVALRSPDSLLQSQERGDK